MESGWDTAWTICTFPRKAATWPKQEASYLGHVIEYSPASGPQFLRALQLRRRRAVPVEEARRTIFARIAM
jgi:hypothetical protein